MIPTVTVRDVNGNVVDPSKYASKGRRLESIQIVILPKGIKAPPATLKGAKRSVATPFVN